VPSIFCFTSSPQKKRKQAHVEKFQKKQDAKKRRKDHQNRQDAASALMDLSSILDQSTNDTTDSDEPSHPSTSTQTSVVVKVTVETQTELTMHHIHNTEKECQNLRLESQYFRKTADNVKFKESIFENNTEKVRFFTGLPSYTILIGLFSFIKPEMKETQSMSKFQQYLLTLMRLRLNLPLQLLAHIFSVNIATISRIFNDVIDIMNFYLVPGLVMWPDREELRKTLPISFRRKFKNCACIIDCFEIFIERPSDLEARTDTFSNYKSHNTGKYLIGITPQGVISFISRGWGGRTSDITLTENCGLLNNLLPGDVMLADRGFMVQDLVAAYNAELKIPAFTKGKKQLNALDVERSRELANSRIHVERVIGVTRQKYTMLQNTMPITMMNKDPTCLLTTLDKVVRVACALTNTCISCVPFE